jgi:hypothetical protein
LTWENAKIIIKKKWTADFLAVHFFYFWFSGIFRDAPPNVGRIANPTYAAPPDILVYHGNSQ